MNQAVEEVKKYLDPVCKKHITSQESRGHIVHQGITYYFCAEPCRRLFAKIPEEYITGKKKGRIATLWRKYLCRLEKATGGKRLRCH